MPITVDSMKGDSINDPKIRAILKTYGAGFDKDNKIVSKATNRLFPHYVNLIRTNQKGEEKRSRIPTNGSVSVIAHYLQKGCRLSEDNPPPPFPREKEKEESFVCDICQKPFPSKFALSGHMTAHRKAKATK